MPSPLDTYPGVPQTLNEKDGYVAGYWLGTNDKVDARIIRDQPWQSNVRPPQGATTAQPSPQFYWHRVGIEDALAGVPMRLPLGSPLDPQRDGANNDAYQAGYALAKQDPVEAQKEIKANSFDVSGDSTTYWRLEGIREGLAGMNARTDLPAGSGSTSGLTRTAPGYVRKQGAGPGVFVPAPPAPVMLGPSQFPFMELVAELPLIGKIPYDLAVGVQRLDNGSLLSSLLNGSVRFRLIGDGPDDPRDGFGLSGPTGPIAQRVMSMIASGDLRPDPRTYGLKAWIGTRTKGAIRLLGPNTLRQLNLD